MKTHARVLKDLVREASAKTPEATAVRGPDGILSYGALDRLANQVARGLFELGVRAGDRVGIWLEKSTRAVAAMQGVLRLGAAYVPIDPLSPAVRAGVIVGDCAMRALVTTSSRMDALQIDGLSGVPAICIDGAAHGLSWEALTAYSDAPQESDTGGEAPVPVGEDDLAYILYTSGSTGKPKGVCISQRNALAFIDWSAEILSATPADRFANHAPFHFDLSVLDLYVAFHAGATVCLIPDGSSWMPRRLVDFIQLEQITVWYSVPSALILMMDQGGLLDEASLPLRALLFAGEPFPVKQLRRLWQRWPSIRHLNLYGPTETNVCTFYEVQDIPEERTKPVPIGRASCGDRVWAVKEDGTEAGPGQEGELLVTGPTVMLGYWGQPPHGDRPYPTGDLVRQQEDGDFVYLGRRDHQAKVRGYRIELGEIEAALTQHPDVQEAAVIVTGSGMEAKLVAFLVSGLELPLLAMKRHCAERLPRYMIIDDVRFLPALPRTRNGKVDRLWLSQDAERSTTTHGT